MEIGSVIREKRTAQGLTQEQVATALGVSAPAVSKWERGESFPEITLLPALARLLGTDLNGLLSFQQEMGREEIAAFLGRLVQAAEEGPQAAFALARAQVGQFPRCDSLALNVALTLEGVLTMAGREGSAEEREWIQALYRQAAESRDQAVACQAQAMLFGRAMEEGDFAQAEALLDRLPPQPLYDRAQMEARLAQAKGDGDRAGQLLEHQLLQQASGAQTTLLALLELAGREGRRGDLAPLADKAGPGPAAGARPLRRLVGPPPAGLSDPGHGRAWRRWRGCWGLWRPPGPGEPPPSAATCPGRTGRCWGPSCGRASSGSSPTLTTPPMPSSGPTPGFGTWWGRPPPPPEKAAPAWVPGGGGCS
ncbi:MAG: helix-turn-helix domain-containing protein [Evtepia gabavorous]